MADALRRREALDFVTALIMVRLATDLNLLDIRVAEIRLQKPTPLDELSRLSVELSSRLIVMHSVGSWET